MPKQVYSLWKFQMQQFLLETVYSLPDKYYEAKIKEFVKRNNDYQGNHPATDHGQFIYKGKAYGNKEFKYPFHVFPLHDLLKEEFDSFKEEYDAYTEEKVTASRFFAVCLSIFSSKHDLEKVFGHTLFTETTRLSAFYSTTNVPKEELEEFIVKNGDVIQLIQARLVDNILMEQLYAQSAGKTEI